ncbi:cytolethal distending toxin subunit B family protein [Dickeya sp. CFBP 2040]|uniref:cytolethal distending toxin subunit B family protein n=1 Tax=Dickeya sp. CFBP 2040 TaxID=2718531 RepID=UPI00144546B9|nr:cytolethal distending toxin subunit B family protein [Dickeya sp. CFBP 2040]NKI75598.1 cytolethal distending toxin subunit B family protein [Dickeya sp. CFBP 2040]
MIRRKYIIAFFIFIHVPSAAVASLKDYKTATWNMQGSSAATESKWNVNVRGLISGNGAVNVVSLQEAGTQPSSANPTGRIIPPVVTISGRQIPIEEFEWNLGTRSRPDMRYIYYAQWDIGAGRVNPAVVTDRRADEVIALRNPVINDGRPVLGVGFNRATGVAGRDFFFTLHASANGGGDARPLLDSIRNHFASRRDRNSQWMVMGDYNQDPNVLQQRINNSPALASNVSIVAQGTPTQRSGGNLDYSVIGQYDFHGPLSNLLVAAMFIAQLHGFINSDHIPVKFFPK